jgi:hypothetical protein
VGIARIRAAPALVQRGEVAVRQRVRVFMSFDRDRDRDLHERLIQQSHGSDSPFEVADWSGRDAGLEGVEGDESLRTRIGRVDAVIVLCGEHTDSAIGVTLELRVAQDQNKPYFMVRGRRELSCTRPVGARLDDSMYTWLWSVLKSQIGSEMRKGTRPGATA